jgi:adenylate cyclase
LSGDDVAMTTEARILTKAELAREADVDPAEVDELVAAAILRPDPDDNFAALDVPRVRLAHALREGGITPDDLRWAIQSRQLPIDRVAEMSAPPSRSDHTFGELMASLGDRGDQLPAVYAAFGLAVPPIEAAIPVDEEQLLRRFFEVWAMVDDSPEVAARAAHIVGDGMRRITAGTLDLFDEHGGDPPNRLRRGLSPEEAMQPSFALPPLQRDLLHWLDARHTEHEVFERIVGFMERAVQTAGRAQPRSIDPPAIAFVDLAGYTELTVASGDERAAEFATALHVVASRVVVNHGGRVVKQLGDGVLLRFRSGGGAIAGVRELAAAIADAGLPSAHAGIAVGRFVVRDGDVYGNVVNLASRIAAHAQAGEVLLPIDDAKLLLDPADWLDAGEATLKGLPHPIALACVR